ncbi:MAG: hypothetical protein IIY92_01145 [Lachnospiraceae bacterium]|nr:hypothetical protein [Lachnospiraceae bacterium]MBQ3400011.1 hypothetical protein [Lachnospiraceae bacterium]MBQ4309435.1 hypothetical protein [Lachnospiraceae bacterium]
MTREEALDALLAEFVRYYNIDRETPAEPFAATAVFHLHNEHYFLIKKAKFAEQFSNEYVYFAEAEELTPELYGLFEERAWEDGMAQVRPIPDHRNSDVTLYIVADRITPEAAKRLKKARRSKTYKMGLQGYSHYRVIACELSTETVIHNYMGDMMKKSMQNIFVNNAET